MITERDSLGRIIKSNGSPGIKRSSGWKTKRSIEQKKYLIDHPEHPLNGTNRKRFFNFGMSNKKHSPSTKKKISDSKKGREVWNTGKIGLQVAWNKGLPINEQPNYGKKLTTQTKEKISKGNKGKIISSETRLKQSIKRRRLLKEHPELMARLKLLRANVLVPKKDTSIEVKMQLLLKQLGIEFYTHQCIKEIEHFYQCDIVIPSRKLVIEVDGDYWHGHFNQYPLTEKQKAQQKRDLIRTNELRQAGWRVLRFWESEIKPMELIDLRNKLVSMEVIQ